MVYQRRGGRGVPPPRPRPPPTVSWDLLLIGPFPPMGPFDFSIKTTVPFHVFTLIDDLIIPSSLVQSEQGQDLTSGDVGITDRGMASRQNGWKRCSNARFELLWSRDPSLANSRHLQGKFLWSLDRTPPMRNSYY